MPQDCDLLVDGISVLADANGPAGQTGAAGQAIAIADGRIAAIGPAAEVGRDWRAARVIDGAGGVAVPGLVDAHAHPGFVVGADWTASGTSNPMAHGGDIAMMIAIFVAIFDSEVPADVVQPLAELTYASAALQGQSAMVDAGSLDPQAVATAARRVGLRTRVSVCGFDLGPDPLDPAGKPVPRRDTDRLLAELDGRLAHFDRAGVPAAVTGFWPMLCSDALLDGIRQLAHRYAVPVLFHVSAVANEDPASERWHGRRNVPRLAEHGLVNDALVVSHAGHLGDADLAELARAGAAVNHNPVQNALAGKGIAERRLLHRALAAGVPVGLGTDTAPEVPSSLLDGVRASLMLARDSAADDAVLTDARAVELATLGGARCLGVDRLGALHPGWHADLTILRPAAPSLALVADPVRMLCTTADSGDVGTVIVAGAPVVADGRLTTVDVDELRRAARKAYADWRASRPR